jgi:hypothetical protein
VSDQVSNPYKTKGKIYSTITALMLTIQPAILVEDTDLGRLVLYLKIKQMEKTRTALRKGIAACHVLQNETVHSEH